MKFNRLPVFLLCLVSTTLAMAQKPDQLLACGNDKVLWLDASLHEDGSPKILWQWQPTDSPELPETYKTSFFRTVDDCKPLNGGEKIMITSSSGGVTLIDKATKHASFFSYVPNAHSIEALPNNRLVVAASTNKQGNYIAVFNQNELDAKPLSKTAFTPPWPGMGRSKKFTLCPRL